MSVFYVCVLVWLFQLKSLSLNVCFKNIKLHITHAHIDTQIYTHTHIYTLAYIYIYIYIYVCVCACVKERERERECERERTDVKCYQTPHTYKHILMHKRSHTRFLNIYFCKSIVQIIVVLYIHTYTLTHSSLSSYLSIFIWFLCTYT